jgi:hypothetical protein
MSSVFNDWEKLKPEPRVIGDEDLLRQALGAKELKEHERDLFTVWLTELRDGVRNRLSMRQRVWANDVLDRSDERAANLVSRGLVPRGREVAVPEVLRVLPKRPPGQR